VRYDAVAQVAVQMLMGLAHDNVRPMLAQVDGAGLMKVKLSR
jgi:hypothetical protein